MKLSRLHLLFWENQQARPGWTTTLKHGHGQHSVSIHALINEQGGVKVTDGERAAQSMVALVRSVRKREGLSGLLVFLDRVSVDPGTVITPAKRSALARRWIKRLRKGGHV